MALTPDGDKLKNDSLDHMKTLYNWANASACPGVAALLKTGNVKVGDITRGDVFKVAYGNTVSQSIGVTVSQSIGYKCDTALSASQELKVGVAQKLNFGYEASWSFTVKSEWNAVKKELVLNEDASKLKKVANFVTFGAVALFHTAKHGKEIKEAAIVKKVVGKLEDEVALYNLNIAKKTETVATLEKKILSEESKLVNCKDVAVIKKTVRQIEDYQAEIEKRETQIQKTQAQIVKHDAQIAKINALTLLPG